MISSKVVKLCQEADTVSSVLAANPTKPPGSIVDRLYGHHVKDYYRVPDKHRKPHSEDSLEAASKCGRWGPTRPSQLFLKAFADALNCLDAHPMCGVVSPPLMGSHGTIPLTVIAPLGDVIRHCSNLIARAEREVFFVTCEWSESVAQRLLRNALIELSRRAGLRRQRVVVKMMFDQMGPSHVIDSHKLVLPAEYAGKGIRLPSPDEIPHVDLEVVSLHKAMLGTLHAKFCVVDRQIAAVMSNNIEDNANLEMMTHLEGPIVDSIYDTALITWNNTLNPPLPSLKNDASAGSMPALGHEPLYLAREPGAEPTQVASIGEAHPELQEHTPQTPHYDDDVAGEVARMQSCYATKADESRLQAANRQLNLAAPQPLAPTGPDIPDGDEMTPYITTETKAPVPMAMVSRAPYGPVDSSNANVPQNEAWLSLIRNAKRDIFIQTPDLNAVPLAPALAEALNRGVEVTYYVCFGYNDAGELLPFQGGTNEQAAQALIDSLPPNGPERDRLHIYQYVAKDQNQPIHQSFHSRSCHIKLLIADYEVAVQGSGNQDTQSWFHSQEVNVMVDSREICRKWREGIERNQNTKIFGRVAQDGVWRDAAGMHRDGYVGNPGQVEGWFKGALGMSKKIWNGR